MFQFGSRRGNEKEKSGLAQAQTHSSPDTVQQIRFLSLYQAKCFA